MGPLGAGQMPRGEWELALSGGEVVDVQHGRQCGIVGRRRDQMARASVQSADGALAQPHRPVGALCASG